MPNGTPLPLRSIAVSIEAAGSDITWALVAIVFRAAGSRQ